MYQNTRRRSGRKCILDAEIPIKLERRIRDIIVKERKSLKNLIKDHVNKEKLYDNNLIINAKSLDKDTLNLKIKYLERARSSLLKIISIKSENYNQILRRIDGIRRDQLEEEVLNEEIKNEKEERIVLDQMKICFTENIQDFIKKIKQYKEEYDKKNKILSNDI